MRTLVPPARRDLLAEAERALMERALGLPGERLLAARLLKKQRQSQKYSSSRSQSGHGM